MRNVINKGITEEDLLDTAFNVYRAGWRSIKLYFMIGLPGETAEDVEQISVLSRKVKDQAKKAGNPGEVGVSVSTFVPKAHTPFQWEPQISVDQIREQQYQLHVDLKKRKLNFKWQEAQLTFMEGVFARGDRRLAPVLKRAVELGCRFDGWGDHFKLDRWLQAFRECDVQPEWYLRRRELDEVLPWDHLDCGVTREFLLKERQQALKEAGTKDCRFGECSACGVCDFTVVKTHRFPDADVPPPVKESEADAAAARVRLRFAKDGQMRFLSHLELLTVFTRAVSRGKVPILFSKGFHPHPRFSFATATSVGVESMAEYMDMFVAEGIPAEEIQRRLNGALPDGLRILEAALIDLKAPSLSTLIERTRYRITFAESWADRLPGLCEAFIAQTEYVIQRKKKGEIQSVDLRAETTSLHAVGAVLELVARRGKPMEFARAITGEEGLQADDVRIEKLEVVFSQ